MKIAVLGRKKRILFWLKLGVLACLAVGGALYLVVKKDALVVRSTEVLQSLFKRQTDLDLRIGSVHGHLLGWVKFNQVRVEAPWLPEETRTIFKAEEIRVQYRFLDFISKKFDSKIVVTIRKPVIAWVPRLKLRRNAFPFLGWMREWTLSGLQNLELNAENMEIIFGDRKKSIRGINASFSRETYHLEVPLTHVDLAGFDVSSVLRAEGHYEPATETRNDSIIGQLTTAGTVVNWKPVPSEASFDFVLNQEELRLAADDFLGGFQIMTRINFSEDLSLEASFKTQDYPFSNFSPFLSAPDKFKLPGRLDLEVAISGPIWEPQISLRARVHEGWIDKKMFKVLDLNGSGVYPTLRLTDSRILMSDGVTTMRFADKAVELKELFKPKALENLIIEAPQEQVVWGDWELSRPKDSNDLSEFLMQRLLGDNARVHFRRYNKDREKPINLGTVENAPVEVGFEYRIKSKDAFKVEVRDGEEFVGVERKVSF